EDVVAGTAAERIVVVTAVERVSAAIAQQNVVAASTMDDLGVIHPNEYIPKRRQIKLFDAEILMPGRKAGIHRGIGQIYSYTIRPTFVASGINTTAAIEHSQTSPRKEQIVARATGEHAGADVRIYISDEGVIAITAKEKILATGADEIIVALVAMNRVVAGVPDDNVVAGEPKHCEGIAWVLRRQKGEEIEVVVIAENDGGERQRIGSEERGHCQSSVGALRVCSQSIVRCSFETWRAVCKRVDERVGRLPHTKLCHTS